MAMPRFESIAEYLASFPKDVQQVLRAVRTAVRKAVPKAEESLSYNIRLAAGVGGVGRRCPKPKNR
jgi:uncharacterized protein YdhG (YjbR/CyaY superfamily)